ncbi:MAG: hypothetical protein M0Z33_06755 [Actinomycetota bacterium]|nr:hypothetical protein [Actinomycetota bacterium]
MTRVVTLMGSGETAPTMVRVHRQVLERLGPAPVPAVLLDTPFGFQENAAELVARIRSYFSESLRTDIAVGSLPGERGGSTPEGDDRFASERLVTLLRDARYVFAGPGSPSYALRRWSGSVVPGLLVEKLAHGGAVTFASAAALTLGAFTVPVYEIYKVGEEPRWLEGLDVLGAVGLHVAVVPHYNNSEGGTHDTRYCYLGERRLSVMEAALPDDHFVLGVDEHTACVVDLEERTVSVAGVGTVTARRRGRSTVYEPGAVLALDELVADAFAAPHRPVELAGGARPEAPDTTAGATDGSFPAGPPLLVIVRAKEEAFAAALAERDAGGAVAAILELEDELERWAADVPQQDERERARASLRSMVVELGRLASAGVRDPRDVVGPFVSLALELRKVARDERRFAEADLVRDGLVALGVELRDGPDGTDWVLGATP